MCLLLHISYASSLLKDIDIDRIEPLLVTFCSLYSMSLVPLHDDEFFRGPPHTAFRINEISDMVVALRDVCMGIIRYMYPEKQINVQPGNPIIHKNDDEESMNKVNRLQKQTEIARQKASKFSRVFKVKDTLEVDGMIRRIACLDHCTIIATTSSKRCEETILSTGELVNQSISLTFG